MRRSYYLFEKGCLNIFVISLAYFCFSPAMKVWLTEWDLLPFLPESIALFAAVTSFSKAVG